MSDKVLAELARRKKLAAESLFGPWTRKELLDTQPPFLGDCYRNRLAELEALERYHKAMRTLLNKVNAVTSWHPHGAGVTESQLDELSNRQIEIEDEVTAIEYAILGAEGDK